MQDAQGRPAFATPLVVRRSGEHSGHTTVENQDPHAIGNRDSGGVHAAAVHQQSMAFDSQRDGQLVHYAAPHADDLVLHPLSELSLRGSVDREVRQGGECHGDAEFQRC
ncbi:hypothetical protein [Krasilnikovia sp. M28-CT-15]|uniref:hypothetical protein n=1 Tax=Krasilnikovia sp. M28-CT-15 TaxID=3373540 RepID=UPI00399D3494